MSIYLLGLWACTWSRAPGPAPLAVAAEPVRVVGQPAGALITWIDVTLRAGSAHDPIGEEGLAWHTAELLRQGGAGGRDEQAVEALLYRLGTDVEVMVDRELVSLRVRCLTEDLPQITDLLGDMLLEPELDEAVLSRLTADSLAYLEATIAEDDESLGMAALESWLFTGHRYSHQPRGRAGVVEGLSVADIERFRAQRYVRPALVLGVAGPMIAEDGTLSVDAPGGAEVAALAARLTAGIPAELYEDVTPRAVDTIDGRELLIIEKETDAVGMHFGHVTALRRDHPDWPAMLLATTALGEHRQSHGRLYRALRGARGLNYGSYAYIEAYRQDGWSREQETATGRVQNPFYVWLRPTTPTNAAFALKAAVSMVDDFVAEGLGEEEFETIRSYLAGRVALWAASPERRLGWAVEAAVMDWPDPVATLPAQLGALDRESVNAAIRQHIDSSRLRIVAVTGDAAALAAAVGERAEKSSSGEDPNTTIVYEGTPPAAGSEQAAEDDAHAHYDLGVRQVTILNTEELFR
ncbi:MAG: zinc protease [Myxococcota bacterium]|jgi:zinc protease